MRDPNTALLEDLRFFFVNVHNMGGNDIVAEHAEMVEPAHRTHAVSFNAVLHFFFCFGHMQRQSLTVGFGRFGAALQQFAAHRVYGMRRNGKRNAAVGRILPVGKEVELSLDFCFTQMIHECDAHGGAKNQVVPLRIISSVASLAPA